GGLAGVSAGSSRTESASWIADNAASVGSLIFFGVFAMSIVASSLRWIAAAAGTPPDRAHERASFQLPPDPPRAVRSDAPCIPPIAVALSYRLGRPKETSC